MKKIKVITESLYEYLENKKAFPKQVETGMDIEDVDKKEFLLGLGVEKKHSLSLGVRKQLIIQNLSKNPKYYSDGVKKGIFNSIEAINLYKKYFIDKEEIDDDSEQR